MVVYNTESACVFRDFLITFFLSFAGFFFIFSEVALLELTETGERYLFYSVAQTTRAFPLKGTTFSYVHVRPFTAASLASLVFAPPK